MNSKASDVNEHLRLHGLALESPVTLKDHSEMCALEEQAAHLLTPVSIILLLSM